MHMYRIHGQIIINHKRIMFDLEVLRYYVYETRGLKFFMLADRQL